MPTPARMYDYSLGGKDNYEVDRQAVLEVNRRIPGGLDIARQNRLFLYRAVRFLARDSGIRQFLDLGSGLPTQQNVHHVAQEFQPDANVVYVDDDPVVLTHGRAILAENARTRVIMADIRETAEILAHPQVRELIDFAEPVAILCLSVGHSIPDDATLRNMLTTLVAAMRGGSYLAFSQAATTTPEQAAAATEVATGLGLDWKTRTTDEVAALLPEELESVEPGLLDVDGWRPDPSQPPLAPVDAPLLPFIGMRAQSEEHKHSMEFGGVLRRP
ncbi:SAM-dependent methyltransferase [Actinomadura alba]|uniref:SAM-dependent methyltransferase n=2 Tax=Actinomadura alba TaxID=406431 RepID=A0ABR7LV82_9ACTN|nr:SAM-dependent methyltransferase [Actinomadura alba]